MTETDLNPDQTDDQATASPETETGAEIVCGDWWEDNWCSPYLRARFETPEQSARLIVRAYNPAATGRKNRMLVRLGADEFLRTDEVGADEWIEIDEQLPEGSLKRGFCDISLRSLNSWSPGGGDDRPLGLILVDWRLET